MVADFWTRCSQGEKPIYAAEAVSHLVKDYDQFHKQ